MSSSKLHYLKQYTCYQYSTISKNTYPTQQSLQIQFKGQSNAIRLQPKYQIIDKLDLNGQQKLYICRWKNQVGNCILQFFQLKHDSYIRKIQMNQQPSFISIIGNFMYIVGGAELYVIQIQGLKIIKVFCLSNHTVHAVQAGFKQSDTNVKGVYVYSLNVKQGFKKNFYSHQQSIQDKRWWENLTNAILKKTSKQIANSVLKVLIPNVVGVLIMPNPQQQQKYSQICLINLSTMQPIQNCKLKLSSWCFTNPLKSIIKYSITKSQSNYDDCLLISLGEKDKQMIQTLYFHIRYLPQISKQFTMYKRQSQIHQIGLFSMTSGNVVDWQNCKIQSQITFTTQGYLIDYLLIQKGIIFYANSPSRIPISGFINYSSPLTINPILSLQHNLFSNYLIDNNLANRLQQLQKQLQTQTQSNQFLQQCLSSTKKNFYHSILQPNRYSLQFIYSTIGTSPMSQIDISMINIKQLLINWYKLYKIKRIINFEGDILVLRENCISTFLPIQQAQYHCQYQSGSILSQNFQSFLQKDNNSVNMSIGGSYKLSKNYSDYSDSIIPQVASLQPNRQLKQINNVNNLPFNYNKQYSLKFMNNKQQQQMVNDDNVQNYQIYYYKFHKNIQTKAKSENTNQFYQKQDISLKSQIFIRKLLINRVKDTLCFYQKMLRHFYHKTNNKHYKIPQYALQNKQKQLMNYLTFLTELINKPFQQICAHGLDIIEIFINQEIQKIFKRIHQHKQTNMNEQKQQRNNGNVNVFLNIQHQSWKIVNNLFDQVIFVNEKEIKPINCLIKNILNYIRSGYKYLQQYLNTVFNPYQSPQFTPKNSNDNNNDDFSSPNINNSHQYAHFQQSATLLSIYGVLPISQNMRNQLITSFLLKKLIPLAENNKQKVLNKLFLQIIANKLFKQRIRNVHAQIMQGRNISSTLSYESSNGSIQQNNINNLSNNEGKQQIDNSLGIVHLFKIFDSQQLQKYLIKQTDQQLQSIFRVNVQSVLTSNLQAHQSLPTGAFNKNKHTNQDILISWIFKYRIYIQKYKQLISNVKPSNQISVDSSYSINLKKTAYNYVLVCINCLQNIKQCYYGLYNNTKQVYVPQNIVIRKYNFANLTNQQLIQRICCKMIGFDNSYNLLLYQKQHNKILPTSQFLHLLYTILQDTQTYITTVTNLSSIAFYCLQKLLQNPSKDVHLLNLITKYYNRIQLSNMIYRNTILRQFYQKLSNSSQAERIKQFFAYNYQLNSFIGSVNWRTSVLGSGSGPSSSDKNLGSKPERIMSKKSQGYGNDRNAGINVGSMEDNKYQRHGFRNVYLEAVGH